ncbi:MAG: DUF805 domain-containing protein [Desulfobulbaceae bacterium]|nr:DUF805 domain-containing protein [Desulfobulbaceae bacterium]
MRWYLQVLRKYAVFAGRAGRQEYWWFFLFNLVFSLALGLVEIVTGWFGAGIGLLSALYSLAMCVPSLAVTVRRLHDTGRSGWWVLVGLIPLLGVVVLLVFMVRDGAPGENQYGPNPQATA